LSLNFNNFIKELNSSITHLSVDFNGHNNVYSTIKDATNYYYKLSYIQPIKGEIIMKSLIKISAMLLIMGVIFADGAYDSFDIPEFEYQTLQITGDNLLHFRSAGDDTDMNIDLGAAYNFNSQSPGFNLSYGGAFDFDMNSDENVDASQCAGACAGGVCTSACPAGCACGCEGDPAACTCTAASEVSTTNWDIGGNASVEKYLVGGNKGMFAYGDADFSMDGGDQAEGVDDNMDLWLDIGAGYGRVVNARPVAQAYAVADALGGDTSDETVMAIAAVIGAQGSYASMYKDDADEMYYNDLAAAAGDAGAAMKIRKVLNSPAYNITDRSTGYSVRAGLYNNYMRADGDEDSGDFNLSAEYAMPIDMDKQVTATFDYGMGLNDDDVTTMDLGVGFSMAHSYNWATTAGFEYSNSTTTAAGLDDVTTSGVTLSLGTTKAVLNQCAVTGTFGYEMDLEDDGADPIMNLDVTFTYWVF